MPILKLVCSFSCPNCSDLVMERIRIRLYGYTEEIDMLFCHSCELCIEEPRVMFHSKEIEEKIILANLKKYSKEEL